MRWYLIALLLIPSALLMFAWPSPTNAVISMTVLLVGLLVVARFDFLHPYVWFGILYYLYAIGLPVLIAMGRLPHHGYLKESMELQWLAMVAMAAAVGPSRVSPPPRETADPRMWRAAMVMLLGFMALSLPYLAAIYLGGYTSKYQILASDLWVLRLDVVYPLAAAPFAVLLALKFTRSRVPVMIVLAVVSWAVVSLVVSGERDHMLRFAFVVAALYHGLYRRIGAVTLISGVVGMMLLLIVLGQVKAIATSRNDTNITLADPVAAAFRDEFISSGRNVAVLLLHQGDWDPIHGRSLLWTAQTAFRPNALLGGTTTTASSWFNTRFYPGIVSIGGGVGFALVGEGYLNFGRPGVVAWFFVLGLLLRWLYRRSSTSIPWLLIYVLFMPVAAYSLREDSAAILSQGLKHVGLPLVLIVLASRFRWTVRRHASVRGR